MRRGAKRIGETVVGTLAIGLFGLLRLCNPDRMVNFAGRFMRIIGPLRSEHELGRANLAAAFPEKSSAEIDAILLGVWDNLGRMGAEFAYLDRLSDFDPPHPDRLGRIEVTPRQIEQFTDLANDSRPSLVFAAHLANWELPAIVAAKYGLDSVVLYRRPNIAGIDRWLRETRAVNMGELIPTGLEAPVKMADALRRGAHVGMLVDQYYTRGVAVTFFGRRTMANPLLARLAQHFNCPIRGVRVVRLPANRFRLEMTDTMEAVRDAQGNVDIAGTMQAITSVIEGWIREHPEQWLWVHRRWRPLEQPPGNARS